MKRHQRLLGAVFFGICILCTAFPAGATKAGLEDAKKKRTALEEEKRKTEDIIKNLESLKTDAAAYVKKLDANLAKAVMSIGAVKAVEIGDGCAVSGRRGSENNDPFRRSEGRTVKASNHAGGILGGISDGSSIVIRAHVKPTPSISRTQETVNRCGEEINLSVRGRHDPVIVPRAVVVMECMTALTVLDAMLLNLSARMESLLDFYGSSPLISQCDGK